MERTKHATRSLPVTSKVPKEDDPLIKWTVRSGKFTSKSGKTYKAGKNFMARPSEVPKAFRDIVRPLEALPDETGEKTLPAVENAYELEERADGQFNIVDAQGRAMNQKPLTKAEAKAILDKLI